MLSGGWNKVVVAASKGNHSWSSGVVSVVGGNGTLIGSNCIGDAGLVAGWMVWVLVAIQVSQEV